jgi:hypothetical protein
LVVAVIFSAATLAHAQSNFGQLPPRRGDPTANAGGDPAFRNPNITNTGDRVPAGPPSYTADSRSGWGRRDERDGRNEPVNDRASVDSRSLDTRNGSGSLRINRGPGTLPNDYGQVWREYDISPYTARTDQPKVEQTIVDWVLRETGTELWFSEPLGILCADRRSLRVYHTPEVQRVVEDVVARFVEIPPDSNALGLRVVTISTPNWRARALPLMKPVDVQSPGVDAWLLTRENASLLLADLQRRADFREIGSPNLQVQHAQTQLLTRTRPRQYARTLRLRSDIYPGYEIVPGQLDEGYTLQVSPLMSLDGSTVDAVIKCSVDQVEKMVPVSVDVPAGGQTQRAQLQVPQLVSWRLHERFRWPADQVLLLSCGLVASPTPDAAAAAAPLGLSMPMFGGSPRSDALLFVDCRGRAAQQLFWDPPGIGRNPSGAVGLTPPTSVLTPNPFSGGLGNGATANPSGIFSGVPNTGITPNYRGRY